MWVIIVELQRLKQWIGYNHDKLGAQRDVWLVIKTQSRVNNYYKELIGELKVNKG